MDERERNQRKATYESWIADWERSVKVYLEAGYEDQANELLQDIADLRGWIGTMTPIPVSWQAGVGFPEKWKPCEEHYIKEIF